MGCERNTDIPTGSVTTKNHAVGLMRDTDIEREVLILKQVENCYNVWALWAILIYIYSHKGMHPLTSVKITSGCGISEKF